MNSLNLIALEDIPFIKPGDDIAEIIFNSINKNKVAVSDDDIFVIAQKIISKSENRYMNLDEVETTKNAEKIALKLNKDPRLVQTIINESNKIISIEKKILIVEHKLGHVCVNAGVDQSNIANDNSVLLLPENPSESSKQLQGKLSHLFNKNISIIITDSMTRPFRYGVINFALSSSKIQSLIDLKGSNDIYGNKIKGTEVALADELAAAAGLLMGQSNEKKPVVIIKGYQGINEIDKDAVNLIVKDDDDLYR